MFPCLQSTFRVFTRRKPLVKPTGLQRSLTFWDLLFFGVGSAIGAGIFVGVAEACDLAGKAVVFSYLLACLSCAATGYSYAYLAQEVPSTGGTYAFVYHVQGEWLAFVTGFFLFVGNCVSSAVVSRTFARYSLGVFKSDEPVWWQANWLEYLVAVLLLALVLGAQMVGTQFLARNNTVLTTLALVALLGFNLIRTPYTWQNFHTGDFWDSGVSGFMGATALTVFSYLGFDTVCTLIEEAQDPKHVSLAIYATIGLSGLLYMTVAANLVWAGDEIDRKTPLSFALSQMDYPGMALLMALGGMGASLSTVIGAMTVAPRYLLAMAGDGLLPSSLASVNGRGLPMVASVATFAVALLFLVLPVKELIEILSLGAVLTFMVVGQTVLLLPHVRCPYTLIEEDDDLELPVPAAKEPEHLMWGFPVNLLIQLLLAIFTLLSWSLNVTATWHLLMAGNLALLQLVVMILYSVTDHFFPDSKAPFGLPLLGIFSNALLINSFPSHVFVGFLVGMFVLSLVYGLVASRFSRLT